MGEAKKRGTREQRVAAAAPKPRKIGAEERRLRMVQAVSTAMAEVLVPVLGPVLAARRKSGPFH
jgi:hypothetical protein